MIEIEKVEELTDYERFQQYGRIRNIVKSIDIYSCVYERDNNIYVALSSGQIIPANKFAGISDNAVRTWLTLLLNIRGVKGTPYTQLRRRMTQ